MQCAFLDNKQVISDFTKKNETFTGEFLDFGYFTLKLNEKNVKLGKVERKSEFRTIEGRGEKLSHEVIILDFGGLIVETTKLFDTDKLQSYLFPSDDKEIKDVFNETLEVLVNKEDFSEADIESIRNIANCGARYFSIKNRYKIIKKIFNYSSQEAYENLVLDLIENYSEEDRVFANEFLFYLNNDPYLLKSLFHKMNNESTFWGNENNYDRFLQVIYSLWLKSDFTLENNYDYYFQSTSNISKPFAFNYDSSFWFPQRTYTVSFVDDKVYYNYTSGQKFKQIEYDFFQPVHIVQAKQDNVYFTSETVPAIYLAGIIEKNNLEHSIKTLGAITDIALTFSGVGNLTKLRHLTKFKKYGKLFIGGVEFFSSSLDFGLNYTNICTDNDLRNKLQSYNNYIQLALFSGEILKPQLKKKLLGARGNAVKEYVNKRSLVGKSYTEPELKKLDAYLGYVGKGSVGSKLSSSLKGMLKVAIESGDLVAISKYIPKNDNIIDVIIHGDGSKFIIEGKAYSAGDLAISLQEKLAGNDDPIRLLSCSDFESAKEFSKHFPNRDIIATEAIVRIHADGGISTVAKSGNGTQKWYQLRDGKSIKEYKNTKSSSKINDYVELGAKKSPLPDDLHKLISEKYPNLLPRIDDQLGELLVKASDGGTNVLAIIGNWKPSALDELSKSLQKINANNKYKFNFEANGDVLSCYLSKVGNTNRTRIADISDTGILKFNGKDHPFGSAYTIDLDGSKKYVILEKDGDKLSFRDIDASEASDLNKKLNNREKMADLLEADSPICAQLILQSGGVRSNLLKSFTNINNLLKFRDYYPEGSEVYKKLSDLAHADKISVSDLNKIFKDYQAHHIIPVNVIRDNKKLQRILEHAKGNGFKFNDADNSIFLHIDNHSGPHGEYDKQIKKIVDGIPTHNLDEAVDELVDEISKIRKKFIANVIGHKIKVNDIKL